MDQYQDCVKSLRFEHPEYIPVSASILPAAWMKHREAMDEIVARHPILFGAREVGDRDYDAVGGTYVAGGACIWIVGDADYLIGHGLSPLGLEVLSVALTSDADHIITPSSKGPLMAIREALENADVSPEEVATWDMHATATPGDWQEFQNALAVFPQTTRFTARKGSFGHGMSVCGGWELTAQHLGFAKGKLMPIDLEGDEIHSRIRPYHCCLVSKNPEAVEGRITGKINMGVGGINACVICRRWPESG